MRLYARYLEPEGLRLQLRSGDLAPGPAFCAHYASAAYLPALARTEGGGELDEEAACALLDALFQAGSPGGALDVEDDADFVNRLLTVGGAALGDAALASQLVRGGVLGRLGCGRFGFGSLPLRVLRQQVSVASLKRARERVEVGWDSDLVNLLESAALRAEREPEAHLVLLGAPAITSADRGVEAAAPPRAADLDVERLLAEAMVLGAHDVFLQTGRAPSFHGPRGSHNRGAPVAREALARLASRFGTSIDHDAVQVSALQVEAVGRVRVSSSRAGIALRILGPSAFLAPGLDALLGHKRGLVVIGGPPASGRSTSFSALLHESFDAGAVIASLEEPVSFPRCDFQWNAEPARVEPFLRAVRTSVASVVGFDLIEDAQSVDLAPSASRPRGAWRCAPPWGCRCRRWCSGWRCWTPRRTGSGWPRTS